MKKSKIAIWAAVIVLVVLFLSTFLKKEGFQFFAQKDPFLISFGKIGKVSLIVIEDTSCSFCKIDSIKEALEQTFKFLEIKKVSSESEEGKEIIKEQRISALPAFIFNSDITKDKNGQEFLNRKIVEKGEKEKYLLNKDLLANISFFARDIKDRKLDLFVMSGCPFGMEAENTIISYLKDNPGKNINLEVHYILDSDEGGNLRSLHGEKEVQEDLRQIIVQKYYNDKFFSYLLVKNKNKSFEEAASEVGLNVKEIDEKVKNEGTNLVKEDISLTKDLGVSASPTIIWQNKFLLKNISQIAEIEEFKGVDKYFNTNPQNQGSCN